uniref:Uncharacterized protein n=1 Tax=Bactrocera dorsalis TaxID=27457 RepID=A0A034VAB4_BACDO
MLCIVVVSGILLLLLFIMHVLHCKAAYFCYCCCCFISSCFSYSLAIMSFLCAKALQKIDVACNNHKKAPNKNIVKKSSNNNYAAYRKVQCKIAAKGNERNKSKSQSKKLSGRKHKVGYTKSVQTTVAGYREWHNKVTTT